jgi:DNA-binding transcriptional regulator YhcF (GntR family)
MLSQSEITERLRDRIVGELHLGRLHAGDRLPGVREVADELDVGVRAVVRAYRTLAEEGLVEVRSRSGAYVAPQERLDGEVLEETAAWLADTLVEAVKRRLTVPRLPEFVRRCTTTVRPRVALLESTEDHLTILTTELEDEFGFQVEPIRLDGIPDAIPPGSGAELGLPPAVRAADLIVTTAFHAHRARAIATSVAKPLVVLTIHPNVASALERQLRSGTLTVVCVDPAIGKRITAIFGGRYADRIHMILAEDREQIAGLDPDKPVLLTLAARRRLGDILPLNVLPHSPSISPDSARELMKLLIRLNVAAERGENEAA